MKKILLIGVLAALPFVPALIRGEVFVFRDHFSYFLPLRHFTAESLRAGELPLWNPYNACGEQWLANPQSATFYPPAWIFVLLPFTLAYTLYLWMHVVWTGIGAYVLFRQRVSEGAALVGGVMLMLSGPTLSLIVIFAAVVSAMAALLAVYISRKSLSRHMSSLCQAIPSLALVSRSSTT